MAHLRALPLLAAATLWLVVLPATASAQTVTVTSTADAGAGTLREAIDAVNAGTATSIDLTGVSGAISLATPLPAILNPVTITGPAGGTLTIDGSTFSSVLLDAGADVTLVDFVVGDGFTKQGAGTLWWDGVVQSYAGMTAIDSGTLATSTNLFLSGASAVNIAAGATLDMTDTAQVIGALSGAGTVVLGNDGDLEFGDTTSTTFSGVFDGSVDSSVLKAGTGTVTIDTTDALADAGFTIVSEGTLALGASQTVTGIAVNTDAVLDLGGQTLTIDGDPLGGGVVGTVTGSGTMHVTGVTGFSVDSAFGGELTFAGSVVVDEDAVLFALGDDALGGNASLTINDNAFVEVGGNNTISALSGNGGELFLCDCTELTVDQGIDTTFAGTLSGDADSTFIKAGMGRLALTGDGTGFLGTFNVSGGTLAGTTNSLAADIVNNATVEFDQDFDGDYGAEISGTGAVVKNGSGAVTFTGSNDYTGGTVVNAGTLVVGADGAIGLGPLTMNGGTLDVDAVQTVTSLSGGAGTIDIDTFGELWVEQSSDTTFGGTFAGDGLLGKYGSGTLTLTGTSTFAGFVDVSGGTLALGGTDPLAGAEGIEIYPGGEVRLLNDQTLRDLWVLGTLDVGAHTLTLDSGSLGTTVEGNVTGSGAIIVNGVSGIGFISESDFSGALTLQEDAGSLLYVDNAIANVSSVTINDNAYLEVMGVQRIGTLSGNGGSLLLCDCAELTVDQDADSSFAGLIEGDVGSVFEKAGSGRLLLSGDGSNFFGAFEVSGGTLAGTTDVLVADILNGAAVEFDQSADGDFDALISGTGSVIKSGSGAVTFTGENLYTGGTVVNDGTLVAGVEGALGNGALTMNGGTLDLDDFQSVTSLSGNGGTIDIDTFGALWVEQSIDTTFGGTLSGNGVVYKEGAGRLELQGSGTYTGTLAVFDGTVAVGGSGTLLATSIIGLGDDARLELLADQTFGDTGVMGTLAVGAHALTFDTRGLGMFVSGNVTGTGSIVVDGEVGLGAFAAIDFAGAITFQGDTVSALFADDSLAKTRSVTVNDNAFVELIGQQRFGSLSGNGGTLYLCDCTELTVNQRRDGVFEGTLTGDAGSVFIKEGEAQLTLAGDGSMFFGSYEVREGALIGTTTSLIGDIRNDAVLEFNQSDEGTFSGLISGTGLVVKNGTGTVTLEGANTHSGGTTIASGTLLVASDASLGASSGLLAFEGGRLGLLGDFMSNRDVAFGLDGTIDTGAHDAFLGGNLTGRSGLIKTGTGLLFLGGTSSYAGNTTVLEGVLGGHTSSLRGNIANSGIVLFDQQFDGVFGGTISGTGGLVKDGAGALTIETPQTYVGNTFVNEGTLNLNSSLAGTVIVGNGTLGFSVGSPATFVRGAGGGADAGAGGDPVDIGGHLVLTSSSIYSTPVQADGTVSTLTAGGDAIINGATLHLSADAIAGGTRRQSSTIIQAASVAGGFGAITGVEGTFDPYLFADGSSLSLLLVRTSVDFSQFAQSFNGSAVGAALAAAQQGSDGTDDLHFVTRELAALATDEEVASALDRISGAAHASFAGISLIASADVIDVLTTRLAGRGGWWLQGLGSNLSLDADVDPGLSRTSMRGALAGYDRRWQGGMAGVSAGYTDNDIDASGGLDNLDGRAYRGAAYGQVSAGRMVVDGIVSAASHRVRGSRGIRFAATLEPEFGGGLLFGGVDRTAAFDYDAFEIAAVADAGYRLQAAGFDVQPAVGFQFTRISRGGFAETGADALDLSAAESGVSSTAARARLSIERRFTRASGRWFAPRAGLRYTHELRDRAVPFAASIAGAPFTASGFALPGSLFAARAGVAAGFGALTVSFDYRAAFAAGHRHHLLSAGFGF